MRDISAHRQTRISRTGTRQGIQDHHHSHSRDLRRHHRHLRARGQILRLRKAFRRRRQQRHAGRGHARAAAHRQGCRSASRRARARRRLPIASSSSTRLPRSRSMDFCGSTRMRTVIRRCLRRTLFGRLHDRSRASPNRSIAPFSSSSLPATASPQTDATAFTKGVNIKTRQVRDGREVDSSTLRLRLSPPTSWPSCSPSPS